MTIESASNAVLELAEMCLRMPFDEHDRGKQLLHDVVKLFPTSLAAEKATAILHNMERFEPVSARN